MSSYILLQTMNCSIVCKQLAALLVATAAASAAPLELETTIPLPGVNGRIDHLAADAGGQRLFVAALGNNTVEVIDLKAAKRVRSLAGFHEPQGLAWLPEFNRLVAANGGGGKCDILDGSTFEPVKNVNFGDDADNVRYDAKAKRVYVGYGKGGLGIISAGDGSKAGEIKLAGHPESFQLEKNGSRIFVNVPGTQQVAVVDREKNSVVATWPLKEARANFPMALDEANARLFIGCRAPAKLVVLDSKTGRVVATAGIDGDTDDLFYDAKRKQIYVVCGAGVIDVFRQESADAYSALGKVQTAAGARTGLFVPDLDWLFVAVPHRGGQGAEVRVFKPQ
jgi:DNA-binding beta-propeller fold protein YncE